MVYYKRSEELPVEIRSEKRRLLQIVGGIYEMKTVHQDLNLSNFLALKDSNEMIEGIKILDSEMESAIQNNDFKRAKALAFVQEKLLVRLMLPQ
jgi:hypothetical protein